MGIDEKRRLFSHESLAMADAKVHQGVEFLILQSLGQARNAQALQCSCRNSGVDVRDSFHQVGHTPLCKVPEMLLDSSRLLARGGVPCLDAADGLESHLYVRIMDHQEHPGGPLVLQVHLWVLPHEPVDLRKGVEADDLAHVSAACRHGRLQQLCARAAHLFRVSGRGRDIALQLCLLPRVAAAARLQLLGQGLVRPGQSL
mmetsp:Transcript_9579/g.17446  ORF Transcript_9579/g.17446 Transcript_9579/m.17446 type:complete len:201 (+) Transcript_9579:2579-3181(+)